MDTQMDSQINRARALLSDLEITVGNDLRRKNISDDTLNLSQEILVKMRGILDQSIRRFWDSHYYPRLSTEERNKSNVQFPIIRKEEDMGSFLGRSYMTSLKQDFPEFYNYLLLVQPYNSGYEWLRDLQIFSNERHINLSPQQRISQNETILGGLMRFGAGAKATMRSCFINGIPVNSEDINQEPLDNFDARLNPQRITWIKFVFEGTDTDSVELCRSAVNDGEKIIRKVLSFI